jgi:putative transposase
MEDISTSRRSRKEYSIWQRRFWEHAIRDQADFNRHMDYIHWNPVRHGLVQIPIDWPWSTFHRFVRAGIYPADWGGTTARNLPSADFGE